MAGGRACRLGKEAHGGADEGRAEQGREARSRRRPESSEGVVLDQSVKACASGGSAQADGAWLASSWEEASDHGGGGGGATGSTGAG